MEKGTNPRPRPPHRPLGCALAGGIDEDRLLDLARLVCDRTVEAPAREP